MDVRNGIAAHAMEERTQGLAPAASLRGIASLTGIRGVAALWVFLTHYQAVMAGYLQSPAINTNTFLCNGFRGVDLFFVLSGFILMHVHGEEFRRIAPGTLRRFYILRCFRVVPLNTAVLLVLVPLVVALPDLVTWFRFDQGVPIPYHSHDFSAAGFVQSLFLAQTWTVAKLGEWNGPAWSLSAEVFGYALFPLLACALMRYRSVAFCIGTALASLGLLMVLLAAAGHTQDNPTGTFGLIRMIFCFIAGMSMARCFQLRPDAGRAAGLLAWSSLAWVAASLAAGWSGIFVVFGFCGLIFALAYQRGAIDAVLSSRPAMALGRISFSLYMIHYIPLRLSLWLLQTQLAESGLALRVACLAAIPLACLVLAVVTHRHLEVPFQRHARAVLRQRTDAQVLAALAS